MRGPEQRRKTLGASSRMRRAWKHALSQVLARFRRRRRSGRPFFWRLRLWTLAVTFPVPYSLHCADFQSNTPTRGLHF